MIRESNSGLNLKPGFSYSEIERYLTERFYSPPVGTHNINELYKVLELMVDKPRQEGEIASYQQFAAREATGRWNAGANLERVLEAINDAGGREITLGQLRNIKGLSEEAQATVRKGLERASAETGVPLPELELMIRKAAGWLNKIQGEPRVDAASVSIYDYVHGFSHIQLREPTRQEQGELLKQLKPAELATLGLGSH